MRFGILGPLRVLSSAGVVPVTSGRERTVLALLLLHPNQVVPRDDLVDAIWPAAPSTARNQLHICVSRLRRRLRAAGVADALVTDPAGYLVRVAPEELDWLVFTERVAQARLAIGGGRLAQARELLRAALGLWRGPALAGVP